ncbi:MAG TPA: Nif3-like dinuclear metal center hexameric protein [Tepidisphaeraceae bacterium]|jgi:dinuclear metal center YbgI/SA1388 family protein
MVQLSRVVEALEEIAPTANAEEWDNVGLLVGDASQSVSKAILAIDYTPEVAAEAERLHCDLVVAYHPPIFSGLKRVTGPGVIYDAVRKGVAIYSPHTALDVADGGTNDMLADLLGLEDRRPLRLIQPKANTLKLVTFVPENDLERISEALFNAGAGIIGNYSQCSFRSPGTGTFFGEEGTDPAVGESGHLEKAHEIRIETVVAMNKVADVIAALRKAHPYEEPAFDLQQLAAAPTGLGQGRIGKVAGTDRQALFAQIKRELELDRLLIAGPLRGPVNRAACCAGACGEFLNDALTQKCDLYLTGEIRHHDAIKAANAGMTVVCTLHSNSERRVLKRLGEKLKDKVGELEIVISALDRDPFAVT